MAAAARLHGQAAPDGRHCGPGLHQDELHELRDGPDTQLGATHLELTPNQRVRYTDEFDDPNLPGNMHVTIELRKVMTGTEVNLMQEGSAVAEPHRVR